MAAPGIFTPPASSPYEQVGSVAKGEPSMISMLHLEEGVNPMWSAWVIEEIQFSLSHMSKIQLLQVKQEAE